MNEINEQIPFTESNIDKQNYLASLLSLCYANKVISETKLNEIRIGLDKAFVETAEQYTKRASSTISKKRAELVYSSVLYQADIYLLSLHSYQKAIDELKSLSVEDILEKGKECIIQLHEVNIKIFKRVYSSRLNILYHEYNYVIEKSFDEYCKNYSARFDAKNCCASIDYPLLGCQAYEIKSQGIMFIYEYYTGIMLENEFCKYFSKEQIETIIVKFGKIYGDNYSELLFNISEVLFNNFLACLLVDKSGFELLITEKDVDNISNRFVLYSEEDLYSEIKKKFSLYQKQIQNPQLYQYLKKYIIKFTNEILNKIKNECLDEFLVV